MLKIEPARRRRYSFQDMAQLHDLDARDLEASVQTLQRLETLCQLTPRRRLASGLTRRQRWRNLPSLLARGRVLLTSSLCIGHVACRLVLQGGFDSDDIAPRPPFRLDRRSGQAPATTTPALGAGGERTVLGGLRAFSDPLDSTRIPDFSRIGAACESPRRQIRE